MPTWPEEQYVTMVELWKSGKTAKDIGIILGKTRNAIVGELYRRGLTRKKTNQQARPKTPRPIQRIKKPPVLAQPPLFKAPVLLASEAVDLTSETIGTVHFLLRQDNQCRWIVDSDQNLCCSALRWEGKSYCSRHHELSIRR